MQVAIEKITPERAAEYAEKAHPGLRKRSSGVRGMAEFMRAGHWMESPDPIAFDTDGYLVNGRRRLLAIVASGIAREMVVVRDLSRIAFPEIDRGTRRSCRDRMLAQYANLRADEREAERQARAAKIQAAIAGSRADAREAAERGR